MFSLEVKKRRREKLRKEEWKRKKHMTKKKLSLHFFLVSQRQEFSRSVKKFDILMSGVSWLFRIKKNYF